MSEPRGAWPGRPGQFTPLYDLYDSLLVASSLVFFGHHFLLPPFHFVGILPRDDLLPSQTPRRPHPLGTQHLRKKERKKEREQETNVSTRYTRYAQPYTAGHIPD